MKNLIGFTALLVLSCLSSSAQPIRVFKGYVIKLDTAVIFNIGDYRQVRHKITIADSLIDGWKKQRDSLQHAFDKQKFLINVQDNAMQTMQTFITDARGHADKLNEKFDRLYEQAMKPDPVYKNPFVIGPVCITIGILIGAKLAR